VIDTNRAARTCRKGVREDPLLKVPPARRGNRAGAILGSPRDAGGNLQEVTLRVSYPPDGATKEPIPKLLLLARKR
jgi:hypothetical protein